MTPIMAHWQTSGALVLRESGALSSLSKPLKSKDTLAGPCAAAPSPVPALDLTTAHLSSSLADVALGD